MERYHRGFILFIIYTSIPLAGLSSDIYVPALPQMASLLQSTSTVLQLSIGIFMLGYAIAQVIAGPLTDACKRKTLMLCGSITSILCIIGIIFIHIIKVILVLNKSNSIF